MARWIDSRPTNRTQRAQISSWAIAMAAVAPGQASKQQGQPRPKFASAGAKGYSVVRMTFCTAERTCRFPCASAATLC